jgi:nucleoside-diphosphate-sugar epimerase
VTRTALLVGGSGPTGPHVVAGLAERGYAVTVLHRGTHEAPELAPYEHLHADPHFREPLEEALAGRTFDVAIAAYGRIRVVADALAGRCGRLVAVSGLPAYAGYHDPAVRSPRGLPVGVREEEVDGGRATSPEAVAAEVAGEGFSRKIRAGELHVLEHHAAGSFSASLFRYPSIYGPRQVYPREWSVLRRVLDGRTRMIVADNGLTLTARCAAQNAAAFLLAAVDSPDAAAGEVFNVGDRDQLSVRQWIELCAEAAGGSITPVSLPFDLAGPGRGLYPVGHDEHLLTDCSKAERLLGYREPVAAADALAATVRWYLEHPLSESAAAALADRFDYAEEDRVVEAYLSATTALRAEVARAAAGERTTHPYAHPKAAGERDHRGR